MMKKKLLIIGSCKINSSNIDEHSSKNYNVVYRIIKDYLKKKSDNS